MNRAIARRSVFERLNAMRDIQFCLARVMRTGRIEVHSRRSSWAELAASIGLTEQTSPRPYRLQGRALNEVSEDATASAHLAAEVIERRCGSHAADGLPSDQP